MNNSAEKADDNLEYKTFTTCSISIAREAGTICTFQKNKTDGESLCRKGDVHEFLSYFLSSFPPEEMWPQKQF